MYIKPALVLLAVAAVEAHVPGMPKLMGRRGFVDVDALPDLVKMRREAGVEKRAVSPDDTCGAQNSGYTCRTDVNKCCSQYGFCGDTAGHCGTGCQSAYGECGVSNIGACGPDFGGQKCSGTQCCSVDGECGSSSDYCAAPGCIQGYGRCDADAIPGGTNTSTVARTALGSVKYGSDIYDCGDTPGQIALTYDDGPDIYTEDLLAILASYNAKATLFMTGINNAKGEIDTTAAWISVIQAAYAAGHQIASHTWSHADLSTLTETGRREEMYKNEMALRNILGKFPTYMRPPYSSCTTACRATMKALGYHIIYFDVDTDDYNNVTPDLIQNAKNNFNNAISAGTPATDNYLSIAHDIHEQTVHNLTGYMLDTLLAKGYTPVTVGECLGDSVDNWYRTAGGAADPPTTTSTTTTAAPTPTGCAVTVDTWCAPPLFNYTSVPDCWTATQQCWDQGDVCYATVEPENQVYCDAYDEQVCAVVEAHCQECANTDASGPCTQLPITYPATPTSAAVPTS